MLKNNSKRINKIYWLLINRFNVPENIAIESIKHYRDFSDNKNLYIYGEAGTGKSVYSVSLIVYMLFHKLTPMTTQAAYFLNIPAFLMELKSYYAKAKTNPEYGIVQNGKKILTYEEDIINKCTRTKILVLDDFGLAKTTGWSNDILYTVINSRYNENREKITIINSNFSIKENFESLDDERIFSRIADMCNSLKFNKIYRKY